VAAVLKLNIEGSHEEREVRRENLAA
jgi:hypothetical protein